MTVVRGFLRHLAAIDGATAAPDPGLLGSTGHRKPPHIYSGARDRRSAGCSREAGPGRRLRPHGYVTLFGLIAATGLRINEALTLKCGDADLDQAVLTVRAGKRGRTRLVPLHPPRCHRWPTTPPRTTLWPAR